MENKENYINMLEGQYFDKLERECKNLLNSIKRNAKLFSFISDRYFSTAVSEFNFHCQLIDEKIKTQLKSYESIITQLNKLEKMPVSDAGLEKINQIASSLVGPAIKLGYCDEACQFLKIIKNPDLNKKHCDIDVSKDVVKILDTYGKRSIIEDQSNFKSRAYEVIKDVLFGRYGKDTKNKLSSDEMENAYQNATVIIEDTVFKMDGSHEMLEEDDEKLR